VSKAEVLSRSHLFEPAVDLRLELSYLLSYSGRQPLS
jgi:hypothetical protein